jgi:hypothetical protein
VPLSGAGASMWMKQPIMEYDVVNVLTLVLNKLDK